MILTTKQKDVAIKIINWCKSNGFTKDNIIAVLGNAYSESALNLNNVQGSYEKIVGNDVEYTHKINNGSYTKENFMNDKAGYGLFQWTYYTRKQKMYETMLLLEKPIDSWEVCEHMLKLELLPYRARLQEKNLLQSSEVLVKQFLRPKDQSMLAIEKRANNGLEVYKVVSPQLEIKNKKETIIYEDETIKIIKKEG